MTASQETPSDLPAALAQMSRISGQLATVSEQLGDQRAYSAHTRKLAWGLVATLVLDLALTIVVTLLSVHTFHQSNATRTSERAACALANRQSAGNLALWTQVVAIDRASAKAQSNGEELIQSEKILEQFQELADKTFAPVNCARLYP